MNIPQIQIEQYPAKVALNFNRGDISLEQNKAEFSLEQPAAILNINISEPQLEIDNYPSRYDIGYKNYIDFTNEHTEKAQNKVLNYISRRAQQGDRLMDIHEEGHSIVDLAVEESSTEKVEVSWEYKRLPNIVVEEGRVDTNYQAREPQLNTNPNPPEININDSRVEVYIEQYPRLEINYTGELLDTKI